MIVEYYVVQNISCKKKLFDCQGLTANLIFTADALND